MSEPEIVVSGKRHRLVVLRVTGRDDFGRPSAAIIGYDDTIFKLAGGEEFVTAWLPSDITEPAAKGSA